MPTVPMEFAIVHLRLTSRECSAKPRPLLIERNRLVNAVAEATGIGLLSAFFQLTHL